MVIFPFSFLRFVPPRRPVIRAACVVCWRGTDERQGTDLVIVNVFTGNSQDSCHGPNNWEAGVGCICLWRCLKSAGRERNRKRDCYTLLSHTINATKCLKQKSYIAPTAKTFTASWTREKRRLSKSGLSWQHRLAAESSTAHQLLFQKEHNEGTLFCIVGHDNRTIKQTSLVNPTYSCNNVQTFWWKTMYNII